MAVYVNGTILGVGFIPLPTDKLQSQVFEVADIAARDALPTGVANGEVWVGDVVIVEKNANGLRETFKFDGLNYVSTVKPEDITVYVTSATFNVVNERMVIVDAALNTSNIYLPDAASLSGYHSVYIIRTDQSRTYDVVVSDVGGNNIDSATSIIVPPLGAYEFILDAVNSRWLAR